jgi:hypothetical protein
MRRNVTLSIVVFPGDSRRGLVRQQNGAIALPERETNFHKVSQQ